MAHFRPPLRMAITSTLTTVPKQPSHVWSLTHSFSRMMSPRSWRAMKKMRLTVKIKTLKVYYRAPLPAIISRHARTYGILENLTGELKTCS